MSSINQALGTLETRLNEKITTLSTELSDVVTDLEGKLRSSSDEIYAAISKTEDSIKSWVNTQLTSYYTIAQIDAKLAVIEKSIADGDKELLGEINSLKTKLANQKNEITDAYKKAISDAISTNDGVIEGKIQTAISAVSDHISEEINTINGEIEAINNRLNGIEEDLAKIMGMIQSIVVVPSFSDGTVALGEDDTPLYFEILPLEAAEKMESLTQSALSLKSVSTTQTKSDVGYITLPIKAIEYEDGLVKVTTSGEEIHQDFFNGVLSLNARLSITDGLNSISSSFFGLRPSGDVDITSLRIAEYKKRIIDRIIVEDDNRIILAFVDGGPIELFQHSIAPRLYLDYDGFWSVSYNNGVSSARLMNSNAEFINAGNLHGESILSVRFVENTDERFSYQTYQSSTPEVVLEEIGTPVSVDRMNPIQSFVEDNVHNKVTITTKDGQSFTFNKARVMPTGISVLANKIRLSEGNTVSVEFRVNPSNAAFDYDVSSTGCEVSLDYVGGATKSSYVTSPTNVALTRIEQVYDGTGAKKVGQYRAFIKDLETSSNYDDLLALVMTVNDGLGQTVQLSSSAIEAIYSCNLITAFSFLKADNTGTLESVAAVIDGTNITINTPFIFDKTNLIATYETNGAKVFVGNDEQTSGITANDFTTPINYTVLSADGEKNVYTVTVNTSGLPVVYINTLDGSAITSKDEWKKKTTIRIVDADGHTDYINSKLQIKGRGNSTWTYPKKPYALKLDEAASILEMPAHNRWVLLANWMDRTLLRNDVAFYISKQTGLAWTPRGKFVEVVLNGTHIGNYYLCEQIKVGENRVNVQILTDSDISGDALTGGYLIELDTYYDEVNKFKSAVVDLPYMFKEPDEKVLQPEQFSYFQNYISEMENLLYATDWLVNREYKDYLDLTSFVDWWFVYELSQNGEPNHPKSSYLYKDRLGKLTAGPVWDFDWGTFTPGSEYTINNAIYYGRLFNDPTFVSLVKTRWSSLKTNFGTVPDYIRSMGLKTNISNNINNALWPISSTVNGDESMSFSDAIDRMVNAYQNKYDWLDERITNM